MGEKIEIFLSYAHKDKALLRQLEKHLTLLKQRDDIAIWHARDISAGAEWQQAIDEHLNKAHLILLLISPDFMDSDNCYSKEMKRAVERHKAGEARIIPILLRPVDWQKAPFGRLQALPRDAQPITSARNRDHAFLEVAQEIHKTVEEWSAQSTTNLQEAEKKEATPHSEMDVRQTLASATLLETEQRASGEETSGLQGDEEETLFEGRKAALIVGVNNTQRSSLLPDLKHAEDDAYEIASTLRTSACNFVCLQTALTGEKAETQAVRRAVIKLTQQKSAQDLLLFYFLGHALPIKTREGRADIALVTHDFDEAEAIEDATAYLSLRWLREKLYRSDSAARVLIILDCCYAEKMIDAKSAPSHVDVSQLLKECIGHSSVIEQNGRWKIVLTASTYTVPEQERGTTSLLLAALRGDVPRALDDQGNVHVRTLYTYLQDEIPLAQLSNLPEDFPLSCIIATYHEKSRGYLQQLQLAEEDTRWKTVSKIEDEVKIIKEVITDSEYFKRLASLNMPFRTQWFDRMREETASLLDLNREKISIFFAISRVQIQDDFSSEASNADRLERFGLLQGSYPTYGALLCFGLIPTRWLAGAFTRCTLWSTNDRHNGWLEAQDYQRDLITQFESSRDFLQKHLRLIRAISRDERLEELEIPLVALGEALANALVHREYANQASPVYVDIFYDRIEICSPGDPPGPMTMESLEEEHKSHPRNPQIARIFYLYGHVEQVGSGIQRMQNALQKARLRAATFELGKDKTFKVIFYRPQQMAKEVIQSASESVSPVTVFYSYAEADRAMLDQLAVHLNQLKRDGLIEEWHDQQILAGSDRAQEVDQAIRSAQIILLLIGPDFLASDTYYGQEMQQALERHKRGEARVIPIIVRPCDWQHSPFAHLPCLPRNTKPISTWDNQDEAFITIAQELRRIIALRQFPSPQLSDIQRQNRTRLLKRVETIWIKGLLEQSLHRAAWIELHLQEQPDALANPWRLHVQELDQAPRALPRGTSIVEVYDEAERELLLLGEPGSGKTTLLLQLTRTLVDRAEVDERLPMPVIFNLSSWAHKRESLATWLIEELWMRYQVPRQIAQHWIEAKQVLPLLDGLDEVADSARMACVQAIIAYYHRHSGPAGAPLVVCCRSEEYRALPMRLPLQHAISILPLTDGQIEEYLSRAEGHLDGLRQTLRYDAELYELARRPLMLSIFTLTYQGKTSVDLPPESTHEQNLQQAVLGGYVQHMLLRRRPLGRRGTREQFLYWLIYIARQMHQHNQTLFSVESLQPDWLPGMQGVLYRRYIVLFFMLVFGLGVGLTSGLADGLTSGLVSGLVGALGSGLIGRLIDGPATSIEPVEALTWSWKEARSSLPGRLTSGLVFGLIGGLVFGLAGTLLDRLMSGLIFGLVFILISGLSKEQRPKNRTRPNESIWRSGRNGLLSGLLGGLISGLLIGLLSWLLSGPFAGLSLGLLGGLFAGLSFGFFFGLRAFVQHFILRFWLWCAGLLPWNLVFFLDEATERLLLSKIGGGYIFIHPLLQEYFASLEEIPPS